jgi:hypothetical protein
MGRARVDVIAAVVPAPYRRAALVLAGLALLALGLLAILTIGLPILAAGALCLVAAARQRPATGALTDNPATPRTSKSSCQPHNLS